MRDLVGDFAEILAKPAADDCPIVQPVVEAKAWRNVVRVLRTVRSHPRENPKFLRPDTGLQVPSNSKIQRQPVVDRPVVLEPPRRDLPRDIGVHVVRDPDPVPPRDRGQRRKIPRVGIVPYGEQRLDICRNRTVVRIEDPHALAAVGKKQSHVPVLAADDEIVTSRLGQRVREVILDLPVFLAGMCGRVRTVLSNREAAEVDARGSARDAKPVFSRVIVPRDGGHEPRLIAEETDPEFVDRPIAQYVGQRPESGLCLERSRLSC